MINDRDTARAIRAWLDDESPMLPPHVFHAVMDEIPGVRQRRRWLGLVAVDRSRRVSPALTILAVALLVVAGAVLTAGALSWLSGEPPARPFPSAEVRLEAGRYVVDEPFPVRLSLDVPDGWAAVELTPTWVALRLDRSGGPTVIATLVEGVYVDPCRPDEGLIDTLGPTPDDLAEALARLPGLDATPPRRATLGGRPAVTVSLTAPARDPGCTGGEYPFHLWGLPDTHGLDPGDRNELWIVPVGSLRLVISIVVPRSVDAGDRAAVDAVVSSIRMGADAAVVSPEAWPTLSRPAAPSDPPLFPLTTGGPLAPGGYVGTIRLYGADADGRPVPIDPRRDFVLDVPPGWFGIGRGIASGPDGLATASVGAWVVERLHPDPCRWRSSSVPVPLDDLEALTAALATHWSDVPGASSPHAGPIKDPPWNGYRARSVELAIPEDLDLASCDGGEARLWDGVDGVPRTTQPGEHLRLRVIDLDPGLVVLVIASLPDAPLSEVETLMAAGASVWIGRSEVPDP